MANEVVKLKRGPKATMPAIEAGSILVATDTGEAYVDDTPEKRVQIKDSTKLPTAGGTMTGPINMNSQKITGLPTPTTAGDGTNKKYVDDQVATAKTAGTTAASNAAANVASQAQSGTADIITVTRSTSPTAPKNRDTISHVAALKSGSAGTAYGPSSNASLAAGGTFNVPNVTVDKYGHLTAVGHKTLTLPKNITIPHEPAIPVMNTQTSAANPSKAVINTKDGVSDDDIIAVEFSTGNTANPITLNIDTGGAYVVNNSGLVNASPGDILIFKIDGSSAAYYIGCMNRRYHGSGPISVNGSRIGMTTAGSAGSAGPSSNSTLAFGGSFTVPQVTTDAYGRVTAKKNVTITLPAAPPSTSYSGKAPISISGGIISHAAYTTHNGGPTQNTSPGFGGSFVVPQVTSDGTGHVTGVTNRTITLPAAPAQVKYTAGTGISISGTTISHAAYTARSGGPTVNSSPGFGSSFTVPQITSDATGHVTAVNNRTITLPAAKVTGAVADSAVQFRNIVVVPKGTDPNTVSCPVGTIICVKES